MLRHQVIVSYVRRDDLFFNVEGKELIPRSSLSDRFRQILQDSGVARMKQEEGEGVIKNHNRPYKPKHTTSKQRTSSQYTPIHFKLQFQLCDEKNMMQNYKKRKRINAKKRQFKYSQILSSKRQSHKKILKNIMDSNDKFSPTFYNNNTDENFGIGNSEIKNHLTY